MQEDDIIARFFSPLAGAGSLGLKDDAALIAPTPGYELVVTVDAIVAGVHFFADDPPASVARKALRVNLSDLAAKAATPRGYLLTLAADRTLSPDWLDAFAGALKADGEHYRIALLGGDTVRTPGPLSLSITAFGEVPAGRMVPRGGATPDLILGVTGTIGDAALGLQLRLSPDVRWTGALAPQHCAHLADRYLHPQPRSALATALRDHARAAMDVSDGLLGDAAKMMRAAGNLTAVIDAAAVPLSKAAQAAIAIEPALLRVALTGGDDYELLFTATGEGFEAIRAAGRKAGIAVTQIGQVMAGQGAPLAITGADGLSLDGPLKFEHRLGV